jgi:hypothetical protein
MRKLFDSIKSSFTIRPVTATATATGTGVDTQGYFDAVAVLEVGAVSGTTPTLNVKIQESDDNSSWADVSGATFTQVSASNSSQVLRLSELNVTRKRYLRALGTIAGTTPSFAFGVQLLMGDSYGAAVNQD